MSKSNTNKTIVKTINITKTGIKEGVITDPVRCPIARALIAAGIRNPEVCGSSIGGELGGRKFEVGTTKRVENFVTKFDGGNRNLKPFSFQLKIRPDDFLDPVEL